MSYASSMGDRVLQPSTYTDNTLGNMVPSTIIEDYIFEEPTQVLQPSIYTDNAQTFEEVFQVLENTTDDHHPIEDTQYNTNTEPDVMSQQEYESESDGEIHENCTPAPTLHMIGDTRMQEEMLTMNRLLLEYRFVLDKTNSGLLHHGILCVGINPINLKVSVKLFNKYINSCILFSIDEWNSFMEHLNPIVKYFDKKINKKYPMFPKLDFHSFKENRILRMEWMKNILL